MRCIARDCMAWRWFGGHLAFAFTLSFFERGKGFDAAPPDNFGEWRRSEPDAKITRDNAPVLWRRDRAENDYGYCGLAGCPEIPHHQSTGETTRNR
jgi:hypothetical protein